MTITAKLIRNRDGFRFALWSGDRGWEGERNYLVNTDLEDRAMLADGLPQYGDPWEAGGELAECRVYKSGPAERLGGTDTSGEGAAGWCRVPVYYRSPSGASFSVPTLTRAWTELRSVSGTITAQYPLPRTSGDGGPNAIRARMLADEPPPALPNQSAIPPYTKIGNGDGAPVYVGGVEARVHRWIDADSPYDYGRLMRLTRPAKLNNASLVFPRVFDTPHGFTVDRGQALYTSHEVVKAGRYLEIVHVIQLAEHWRVVWQPENAKGEGLEQWVHDNVYTEADFTELWPV